MKRLKALLLMVAAIIMISLLAPTCSLAQPKSGPITEKEVKEYLTYTYCKKSDGCNISFDSPVKIGAAARHSFQFPATNYLCYPVKVNYSTHTNGGTYHIQHYTNAVYYFFRNGFGEWEMNKENEKVTEEKDADQKADAGMTNKATVMPVNGTNRLIQPKIDFSVLEKEFDIIKYEYPTPPDQKMTIYIKPKSDVRGRQIASYSVDYKDKSGNIVGVNPNWLCCSTQLSYTEKGALGEVTIQVPTPTEMKKVISATAVKH